jgi:hypothetical protein
MFGGSCGSRGVAQALVGLLVLTGLPSAAAPALAAPSRGEQERGPFGAECRMAVSGSHVTAYCYNPYPDADRLRLHIECERWWDIDSDSASVTAHPARTVVLTGRCWKEIRTIWVSHQRA